jgi:hypothetical protein
MRNYEKLGSFYLGRSWDRENGRVIDEPLLYDAKDLTTHAVCVGMTGSGKTGLCLALLEEAALDAVPAIAIDPKGDIGNLLLTFPELTPEAFRPWIDETEAAREGITPDELASRTAERWREGLAQWDQDAERIHRLRASADFAIYTPGSTAGIPIAALRRLDAPPPPLLADGDALRERVLGTTSSLLSLLGIDADPLRSREHILLSRVIEDAWRAGRGLELVDLIHAIREPGFDRVGALDLESFFPADRRFELAMALNNLIASPGFAPWTEGAPLDVSRLLWTDEGHPRISVISIAHLSEAERMFFVTLLLNEVVAWVRAQSGSPSLRAILYMDEVFGFFPPVANPPSKAPMLTLLKQARAFGVGVVLATQNAVDLDYKGLANAGTWFIGRMQTERDRSRMLEGLESIGVGLSRAELDALLAGLVQRVFLLHNVHDDAPALFQTRWVMSYLRGPLTRAEIRRLSDANDAGSHARPGAAAATTPRTTVEPPARAAARSGEDVVARAADAGSVSAGGSRTARVGTKPVLPPEIEQRFVRAADGQDSGVLYPALLGRARLHYVDAKSKLDHWEEVAVIARLPEEEVEADVWAESDPLDPAAIVAEEPPPDARFARLPPDAARPASYARWKKSLAEHLYRSRRATVWLAPTLGLASEPGEREADFRIRMSQAARERRDEEVEKLRDRYAARVTRMREQQRRAEERVARESSQLQNQKLQTMVSVGSTLFGALMGRRLRGATTSVRGVGRIGQEQDDVRRAQELLDSRTAEIAALEAELEREVDELRSAWDPAAIAVEPREIPPRKGDLGVEAPVLVWVSA